MAFTRAQLDAADARQAAYRTMCDAAPDLLEALKAVAPYLARRGTDKRDDEAWSLYSRVIAAIAKAEGR